MSRAAVARAGRLPASISSPCNRVRARPGRPPPPPRPSRRSPPTWSWTRAPAARWTRSSWSAPWSSAARASSTTSPARACPGGSFPRCASPRPCRCCRGPPMDRLLRAAVEMGRGTDHHVRHGVQACGEFFIDSPRFREPLAALTGALAANWESAGVFVAALRAGVPPVSIRAVSDLGDERSLRRLPPQRAPRVPRAVRVRTLARRGGLVRPASRPLAGRGHPGRPRWRGRCFPSRRHGRVLAPLAGGRNGRGRIGLHRAGRDIVSKTFVETSTELLDGIDEMVREGYYATRSEGSQRGDPPPAQAVQAVEAPRQGLGHARRRGEDVETMIGQVVVGIDGSAHSLTAFQYAVDLARAREGGAEARLRRRFPQDRPADRLHREPFRLRFRARLRPARAGPQGLLRAGAAGHPRVRRSLRRRLPHRRRVAGACASRTWCATACRQRSSPRRPGRATCS